NQLYFSRRFVCLFACSGLRVSNAARNDLVAVLDAQAASDLSYNASMCLSSASSTEPTLYLRGSNSEKTAFAAVVAAWSSGFFSSRINCRVCRAQFLAASFLESAVVVKPL